METRTLQGMSLRSLNSIPEFIISPPQEERLSHPCLSWLPDERVLGLSNLSNTQIESLFNAVLQLVVCLPELTNELPLTSEALVQLFVRLAHDLTLGGTPIYQEPKEFVHLQQDVKDLKDAIWGPGASIDDIANVLQSLMDLLAQTRFGDRFDATQPIVTLDMSHLSVNKTDIITLLNLSFGIPRFFAGGPQIQPPEKLLPKFNALPYFLVIHLDRGSTGSLNNTALEIPMELDLGCLLVKNVRQTQKRRGEPNPTFYKLHGFVTQKDGWFMTYTRLRSGEKWYKATDEAIDPNASIGSRIESKGVVLCVFQQQV